MAIFQSFLQGAQAKQSKQAGEQAGQLRGMQMEDILSDRKRRTAQDERKARLTGLRRDYLSGQGDPQAQAEIKRQIFTESPQEAQMLSEFTDAADAQRADTFGKHSMELSFDVGQPSEQQGLTRWADAQIASGRTPENVQKIMDRYAQIPDPAAKTQFLQGIVDRDLKQSEYGREYLRFEAEMAPKDPKQRRIVTGADKRKYYEDTGELVLPDVVPAPGTPESSSAPVKNFIHRLKLVEEHGEDSPLVRRFDDYVRSTKVLNLGGTMGVFDPSAPGDPTAQIPVTLKPGEVPEVRGEQAEATAIGSAIGREQGDALAKLSAAEASMPRLEDAVIGLKKLGETATYTLADQATDYARRQAGMEPTEGATSRASYIAHVKNNILPLLRQTFGAAFTVAEGESLLATLGDPDMSSGEKNAVLDAFISDKKAELEVLRRQTGGVGAPQPITSDADYDALPSGTQFIDPDGNLRTKP